MDIPTVRLVHPKTGPLVVNACDEAKWRKQGYVAEGEVAEAQAAAEKAAAEKAAAEKAAKDGSKPKQAGSGSKGGE